MSCRRGLRVQVPGAGGLLYHHAVVGLDGRPGGHAGHDGLGPAGVAGEVVVLDIAQADAPVRLRHHPGDVHRCAPAGDAQADAVLRVAVHAADLLKGPLPCQLSHLLCRVGPVAAQGEHQGDVLRADTGLIQLVQQGRHHCPGGYGAGDVAGDDGDGLPGADDLPQPGRADGLCQGPADLRLPGEAMGHRIGLQHLLDAAVRHLHRLGAGADAKLDFHCPAPHFSAACRRAATTGSSSPVRKRISAPPPVQI